MILDGKRILITGGSGSFGNAFVRRALTHDVRKVIVLSRDELKQHDMRRMIPDERLTFFLGDVRDRDRLYRAFNGVDIVIHAAALKQVPACEYNPAEAKKTNVDGALNVIDAAIDAGVSKVLALSTDKATNPVNCYGATKLLAEKLFLAGNAYSPTGTRFSCVRYGNIAGSRGSIIPAWRLLSLTDEPFPITDRRMTRFWFTLPLAVDFVLMALEVMKGGETFVPRLPSFRVTDLAMAIAPNRGLREVGVRPGEKIHEAMIGPDEAHEFAKQDNRFVRNGDGEKLESGWEYSSGTNERFLTIDELREQLAGVSGSL